MDLPLQLNVTRNVDQVKPLRLNNMFLSVHVYDSPCVLQPPMSSKGGVYIYLKFAVITVHFTNNVKKSTWISDIPYNFQFGL